MNLFTKTEKAGDLWNIIGDFGRFSEAVTQEGDSFSAQNNKISVRSDVQRKENGVCIRTGSIRNISDAPVELYALSSRFYLDGGEYEVYSQYNGWQNESRGSWQPLVTSVSVRSDSVRNANNTAPFMVLWSEQANRGTAFHIIAHSAWEMRVSRVYASGEASEIELTMGVTSEGLSLSLAPGEEIELPQILYYPVMNRTDMDGWRLHLYLNKTYPRREMPVIYNTWLYKFALFSYEGVMSQIETAKNLGVEYFVIDAGWFGVGKDWFRARGDWEENQTFGFCGRMGEVADAVRSAGMKFGFWMEPECAAATAENVAAFPDYYLEGENSHFIDFSKPEALEFIFDKTCALIEKYGAEFVKFDFNADLKFDVHGTAFLQYCKGHRKFVEKLKKKYPSLYIENCASGGMRMTVRDGMLYDSFWPTDDQSPYETLRIFKDSILRLPPQWIECWNSIATAPKRVPLIGTAENTDKILATHDAKWNMVVGVHQSFLEGVMAGGPIGFSCDLTMLSEKTLSDLQDYISRFKARRAFWMQAACHILTDTDSMLVLEFRNPNFSEIELVVFTKKAMQKNIRVYPVLQKRCMYTVGEGEAKSAEEIDETGIDFQIGDCYNAQFLTLKKAGEAKEG